MGYGAALGPCQLARPPCFIGWTLFFQDLHVVIVGRILPLQSIIRLGYIGLIKFFSVQVQVLVDSTLNYPSVQLQKLPELPRGRSFSNSIL
jgi:hypothetical protein